MDKEFLIRVLSGVDSSYSWALYFFKVDRRNNNPYTAYKIRFKNGKYLPAYAEQLTEMIIKYQIGKIQEVKEYTGENAVISCDFIDINNELIKEQWDYFAEDISRASDEKVKGKYHGYLLEGISEYQGKKTVAYLKIANPIISLRNKRDAVFIFDTNQDLAEFSDEICKLHMDVDCIVIDGILYSFNYKFEDLFNLEKTMLKVKNKALEKIISTDAFCDSEHFEQIAKAYKSPRTFITLKNERVERIKSQPEREKIADMLNIGIDAEGRFDLQDDEKVSLFIRYLCFKIFKDEETKDLLEANNVIRLSL